MLFEPYKLKNLNLRNRIVMAPMTRNQSPNGVPTDEVASYYERRAKGEVGLLLRALKLVIKLQAHIQMFQDLIQRRQEKVGKK